MQFGLGKASCRDPPWSNDVQRVCNLSQGHMSHILCSYVYMFLEFGEKGVERSGRRVKQRKKRMPVHSLAQWWRLPCVCVCVCVLWGRYAGLLFHCERDRRGYLLFKGATEAVSVCEQPMDSLGACWRLLILSRGAELSDTTLSNAPAFYSTERFLCLAHKFVGRLVCRFSFLAPLLWAIRTGGFHNGRFPHWQTWCAI